MLKELFSIFGTIGVDNKEANKSIDETNNKAKKIAVSMSKSFETAGKFFVNAGQKIQNVGRVCNKVTVGVTGVFTAAAIKAKSFVGTYESAMAVFEKKLNGGTNAAEKVPH